MKTDRSTELIDKLEELIELLYDTLVKADLPKSLPKGFIKLRGEINALKAEQSPMESRVNDLTINKNNLIVSKTAEEMRIDFYGKDDARAYEYDELYLMNQFAESYHQEKLKAEQSQEASTTEFCQCPNPDRESGYSYCMHCHKHVSPQRMELLTNDILVSQEGEQQPELTAENIEHIFKNTERIHGKSEAIDWIKVASCKVISFMEKHCNQPSDAPEHRKVYMKTSNEYYGLNEKE